MTCPLMRSVWDLPKMILTMPFIRTKTITISIIIITSTTTTIIIIIIIIIIIYLHVLFLGLPVISDQTVTSQVCIHLLRSL